MHIDMEAISFACWDRVVSGMEGAEGVLAAHRASWVNGLVHGEDLRKLERRIKADMAEVDWSWPWFETWFQQFQRWNLWPSNWARIVDTLSPAPDDDEPHDPMPEIEEEAVELMLYSIRVHVGVQRERQQRTGPHSWYVRHRCRWTLVNHFDPPELLALILPERIAAFEAGYPGDPDVPLPPFFPGDCTIVRSWRPAKDPKPKNF